jgi:hypothetical protein
MARKTAGYYVLKANRAVAWVLLPLMLVYVGSGLALCGRLGFDRLLSVRTAGALHRDLSWPLIALFLAHAAMSIYLAVRRWLGWRRRGSRP